jgi:hypothetical protein
MSVIPDSSIHPGHPTWCSSVACFTAGSITEHRSFPTVIATVLDTERRALVAVASAVEYMAGRTHVGEPGVELWFLCPDESEQRGGDVVLDPHAAIALAKALVDAATVVLGEHRDGGR